MKQVRKNKTNLSVNWPAAPYFTIKELCSLNKNFVEITLRVRLSNEIEDGKVVEIGSVPGGKGRPQKVFSLTPVTQTTLNKAKASGITLVDNSSSLVNVISVTSNPQPVTPVSTLPTMTVK